MVSAVVRQNQPTVLLVEDDENVRDVMQRILVREGYLVMTASTGRDAMGLIRHPISPIDAVVLDLQLPDVSGVDLCARFRELQPNLPVMVCTGSSDPEEATEVLRLGIGGYLSKPVPMDEFMATLRTLVA